MVNIHITGDKDLFKSKNAVNKFKLELREKLDPYLINQKKYLKDGFEFDFNEDEDDIYVNIKEEFFLWGDMGTKNSFQQNSHEKLKKRLKEMEDVRTGKNDKEFREMKKTVDKNLLKRYVVVSNIAGNFPIVKPNDLLAEPEKYKQEIQMFSSGVLKLTGNHQTDLVIAKYYKEIAQEVGYEVFSREQIEKIVNENQPPPVEENKMPEAINLSSYVDSDSDSDSDVEDVET